MVLPSLQIPEQNPVFEIQEERRQTEGLSNRSGNVPKEPVAIDRRNLSCYVQRITPKAIRAPSTTRQVDANLVDAQQAAACSIALWATRFLRFVGQGAPRPFRRARADGGAAADVERELAIRAFVPQEYWTIHAMLDAGQPPLFEAKSSSTKAKISK